MAAIGAVDSLSANCKHVYSFGFGITKVRPTNRAAVQQVNSTDQGADSQLVLAVLQLH